MNARDPRVSMTVRASSWGALFDCATRWHAIHIDKVRNPVGLRAALGTAIHKSTAVYDSSRMNGADLTADDAAAALVDSLKNPDGDVDMSRDELSLTEAERIGLTLHAKYCVEISPRYTFRAVEMETKPMQIDCGSGTIVQLTGTMDRSRMLAKADALGIADLKSGSTAVQKGVANTKGHAAQLGTYELLYQHTTGEEITAPAEIIGLKTKGTLEVATGEVRNAKRVMVGTETQPGLIQFAADMFRTGLFPPNPKALICGEKYCPIYNACIYHD